MDNAFSIGWAIFKKSITQLFYNFSDAIKISLPFIAFTIAASIFQASSIEVVDGVATLSIGSAIVLLITIILSVIALCWLAILWHRYMLLSETGGNIISTWNGSRIWNYFKTSFFVAIILLLVILIPSFILAFILPGITESNFLLAYLVVFAFGIFVYFLFLRMGLVLPARALDGQMTIGESFAETDDYKGAIFVAGAIMLLFFATGSLVIEQSGINKFSFSIPSLIFQWLYTMTSISILTTLYGFIVEKRSLE